MQKEWIGGREVLLLPTQTGERAAVQLIRALARLLVDSGRRDDDDEQDSGRSCRCLGRNRPGKGRAGADKA